jgi:amino acid adenylation domain-containing protein/thioester reductase-like protein
VIARNIEQACQRHAERIAVESHEAPALTFAELDAKARGVMSSLRAVGVGANDIVALDLEKSSEYVIALLGVWYAGAAFLPLGPGIPEERRRSMLAEAKPQVILDREGVRAERPSDEPTVSAVPEDLAYVIFTSGSSGRPKGVRVAGRGLSMLFETQSDVFRLGPGKRALFHLSTLFDASISDIGTALISGATLVIENPSATIPELLATFERRSITHVDLPPSLLPLIDPAQLPACLETLVIGGEAAEPSRVRAFARRVRVVNVYGPTEATVCSSLCVCDPERWDRPLLGAPLPGVRYRVDEEELLIGGDCLALGYLARPELDAERFVVRDGERWYRTGDRVRPLPNGDLEFVGRVDRQIKLHGVRIEPGEIEHVLLRHPAVREAGVVLRDRALVAFVSLSSAVGEAELRDHLSRHLPPALVPRCIEIVDRLPRSTSAKLDVRALGARSELGELVAGVLGISAVDERKSFSELGGDSFSALELTVAIESLGIPASVERILSATPIGELTRPREREPSIDAAWLRQAVELDPELRAAVERANRQPAPNAGPVLITGATGALGSRLLHALASHREVFALVRARDEGQGRERIQPELRDRVRVLCGDVRQPRLGLSASDWRDLSENISVVVHAAAMVNVALPYSALSPTNVHGTREVVRLVAEGAPKSLHHVSTLSVFVGTDCAEGVHRESDDLSATCEVYGGYAQSKWAAEILVRTVRQRAVHRLGLLLGGSRDDLFSRFVRGTAKIGAIPAEGLELRFDVTPIEHAVASIAEVARQPVCEDTFHVCGETRSLAELNQYLSAEIVDTREWLARARPLATDRDVATAYLALCRVLPGADDFARHRGADLFEATGANFESSLARPAVNLSVYVAAALEGSET